MNIQTMIIIAIVALVVVILASASYKVAPTDKVMVITGLGRRRFVTGRAAFIIPFLYRRDYLSLGVVQCDLTTERPIPTKDSLLINVSAVANFQIGTAHWSETLPDGTVVDHDPIDMAARNYLNRKKQDMEADVTQVLLGKMREAVGKTALVELMANRDVFAQNVMEAAEQDMRNLGLELTTFNVRDFTDNQRVIESLGAEMAAEITQKARTASIEADQNVAVRQNEYDLKQAALKTTADKAKAEADIVYDTVKAERTKDLNIAQVDAQIAAEDRAIELAEKKALVKEKELDATVRKQAEADRYAAEQKADAALYVTRKSAEADLYRKQQDAEAVRATADADAHSITVRGKAEGAALREKGEGEAAGIRAQGDAYNTMNNAYIIAQQYITIMPEIAKAIAEPLSRVDSITMYGEGNTTKLVGDTTNSVSQISEGLSKSIGLDLKSLLNGVVTGHAAGTAAGNRIATAKDEHAAATGGEPEKPEDADAAWKEL